MPFFSSFFFSFFPSSSFYTGQVGQVSIAELPVVAFKIRSQEIRRLSKSYIIAWHFAEILDIEHL